MWHEFQPLLSYIIPVLSTLLFYYIISRNEKYLKIVRIIIALQFIYVSYIFLSQIIYSLKHPIVWDFTAFYLYGKVAATGHNFYSPENFQTVFSSLHLPDLDYSEFIRESVNVGFFYPPPTIFLFLPLGFLGYQTALVSWVIFNLLFLFGSIYLVYNLFFKSTKVYGLLLIATLFFTFPPVIWTVYFTQTNFILLFLLLLLKKYSHKKIAGILLALAFFVKPYMIIFGLIFLLKKEWKTIGYFVLFSISALAITFFSFGFEPFRSYLFDNASKRLPAEAFSEGINQSLQAVLLRHHIISMDTPLIYAFIAGIILVLMIACSYYLLRKRSEDCVWSFLLLTILLIYPGTLSHYAVMLLFVIFYFLNKESPLSLRYYYGIPIVAIFYYVGSNSLFACILILLLILVLSFLKIGLEKPKIQPQLVS
jgi:hypothetical protein